MTQAGSSKRVIGYLAGGNVDEPLLDRLDTAAGMLTHINYAFGVVGKDLRATFDNPEVAIERPFPGDGGGKDGLRGVLRQLQLLKERHPHLRTLISLGGWGGSWGFSEMAATEEGRRAFVESAIELFLLRWPGVFDGIDIDWEYPVHGGLPENGYRPEDKRNCTLLFEEFRRQMDELGENTAGEPYLLSAAIPAGRRLPLSTFEVREIAQILDFVNLMTYDISGSSASGITNFNAALRTSPTDPRTDADRLYLNVEGSVATFINEGVPRENLVVGMPFYGRGYSGVPDENNGLYQTFTGEIWADYRTIVTDYLPTYERFWHDEAGVPWLFNAETGIMLSYDDPEAVRGKAAFINQHQLGGAMFWELKCDDDDWSLLSAVADELRSRA
ncbi:MAG TPA: glycoside hydrolase family 18 protein [Thermomicrobiales bacterium]|nr:glycoside hydrolase family 18 protein [Thermomicrobiales bacterium]